MRIRGIALTLCAFLTVGLVATTAGASNDTDFAKQWSLAKIGAPEAWAHTTGRGVVLTKRHPTRPSDARSTSPMRA